MTTAFLMAGCAICGCDNGRHDVVGTWVSESIEMTPKPDSSAADAALSQFLLGWVKEQANLKLELSLGADGSALLLGEGTIAGSKMQKSAELRWNMEGSKLKLTADGAKGLELRLVGEKLVLDIPDTGRWVFGRKIG